MEPQNQEEIDRLIDAWKASVDVQKHFNELSLKVRNTAITVLGAGLAATGILVSEGYKLRLPTLLLIFSILFISSILLGILLSNKYKFKIEWFSRFWLTKKLAKERIRYSVFIFVVGIPAVVCGVLYFLLPKDYSMITLYMGGVCFFFLSLVIAIFYLLDRFWYHKLLKGTVIHGANAETKLCQLGVTSYNLGELISKASKIEFGAVKLDSNSKLDLVYLPIIFLLLCISVPLSFLGGNLVGKSPEEVAELTTKVDSLNMENQNLKARIILVEKQGMHQVDSMRTALITILSQSKFQSDSIR